MEKLEIRKYKGKKVLITGHTGFKGTWFMLLLHKLGAQVYGLSLRPEPKSLYHQINGDQYCNNHEIDIRDADSLSKKVLDIQPDYIFHLAAQSLVIDGYEDPKYTYETNVMGTLNLLEVIRKLDRCNVIVITTDKVYENPENGVPFKENDKLGGYDPYSSSKACSEILTASYRRSFFSKSNIKLVTARAGNVIGGGDYSSNRLVPDIINSLKTSKNIQLRSPKAIRPWQHVLDALHGYLLLGLSLDSDDEIKHFEWNFGPKTQDVLSVVELAEICISIWGNGNIVSTENNELHEAQFLQLDSSRSNYNLNWTEQLNSQKAIEWTVRWYKDLFIEKKNVNEICFEQLETFLEKL